MSEQPLQATMLFAPATPLEEQAFSKLARVLGQEKASALLEDSMSAIALDRINTVQELLLLANALIKGGGFPAVVGRTLKVYAILRGASE